MTWKPKLGSGLWVVASLIAGILLCDFLIVRAIWQRDVDFITFLAGLWLALSALLLILFGYGLYCLLSLGYYADRNRVEIHWPLAHHIIPLSAITGIVARGPAHRLFHFRGFRWLGYQIGYGEIEGLGRTWLCATRPWQEQLLLVTPSLTYAISPAELQGFVSGLEERKALGPTQDVEATEIKPSWISWPLWGDRWMLRLMGAATLLNLGLLAHISIHWPSAPNAAISRLPWTALLISWLNQALAIILHKSYRLGAYLLVIAAAFVQLLLWKAALTMMPPDESVRLGYRLIIGLLVSLLIGWLGYWRQALSGSGVCGAVVIGTTIFGFGGWVWGLLLIAFFASSSFLSKYRQQDKEGLAEKFAKGSRRDIGQALANGSLGAAFAIANYLWPNELWFPLFVGVISAVNADTWATEIGVLSKSLPRLIITGRQVPVGTSGGISPLGLAASGLGALAIGLLAWLLSALDSLLRKAGLPGNVAWLPLIGVVGGMAGSLADSLIGATVQGIYYCDRCDKETESARHRCGENARFLRGWRWLSNDWVNWISSAIGGLAALILALLLR